MPISSVGIHAHSHCGSYATLYNHDDFLPSYPVVCKKLSLAEAILIVCCRTLLIQFAQHIAGQYFQYRPQCNTFVVRLQLGEKRFFADLSGNFAVAPDFLYLDVNLSKRSS